MEKKVYTIDKFINIMTSSKEKIMLPLVLVGNNYA